MTEFRAWDNDEGVMIQDFTNYAGWESWNNMNNAWKMDRYTVEQWTGFVDVRGKRVYAGDIMYDWGFGSMTGIARGCNIIEWDSRRWKHTNSFMSSKSGILSGLVVGNIHEHDHLLEDGYKIPEIEELLEYYKAKYFANLK